MSMMPLPSPRDVLRLLRPVLVACLIAPYVALALVFHVARKWRGSMRLIPLARLATASHLRCPRGHASALHGIWECRGCGGLFAGYAFGRCAVCGAGAGHVACEHCGLAVRNPFL